MFRKVVGGLEQMHKINKNSVEQCKIFVATVAKAVTSGIYVNWPQQQAYPWWREADPDI